MTSPELLPNEDRISFPRWWIKLICDGLFAIDQLPSGELGDWAFIFREQLKDALTRATSTVGMEATGRDWQQDDVLAEREFINELGNRIRVALRYMENNEVTIIIQKITATSTSGAENTVTIGEAIELRNIISSGLAALSSTLASETEGGKDIYDVLGDPTGHTDAQSSSSSERVCDQPVGKKAWYPRYNALGACASENCSGMPIWRLERGGVGSNYCSDCKSKIDAIPSQAPPVCDNRSTERADLADDLAQECRAMAFPNGHAERCAIDDLLDRCAAFLTDLADSSGQVIAPEKNALRCEPEPSSPPASLIAKGEEK